VRFSFGILVDVISAEVLPDLGVSVPVSELRESSEIDLPPEIFPTLMVHWNALPLRRDIRQIRYPA